MDTYYFSENSPELESILDALAEINVQLRQVLHSSQIVMDKIVMDRLDTGPGYSSSKEEFELETKSRSVLSNMARTEEAIRSMNQEISDFLRSRPVADRVSAEL